MKVTLKDGSFKEYAQPMAVIDIAKDISEGLARMACVAEIDGEVKDLRTIVDKDCTLNIFTAKDPEGLAALRHTASHVMAQAIKRIWPGTKLAIGPSIADGFYYDIDRDEPVTSDDLAKIEAEMKKIIKEALPLERFELPRAEAIALMKEKNEPYKVELIEDLPEYSIISFYKQGEFTPLCRSAPHEHKGSRQGIQAHEHRRRLLARKREEQDADPYLRNSLCEKRGLRRLRYHDGRGEEA